MPRLVAFDLDDTLAPSKSPVHPRMAALLALLLEVKEVCVISGGRFEQFRDQLLSRLPSSAPLERLHLMPTCGTRYLSWDGARWRLRYAENLSQWHAHPGRVRHRRRRPPHRRDPPT